MLPVDTPDARRALRDVERVRAAPTSPRPSVRRAWRRTNARSCSCIGASYHHKNRLFACRLLGELRRRGWDGRLVLAGPTPPNGNSLADEAGGDPRARASTRLVDIIADVTEDEKNWLYAHAALSVYPTTIGGLRAGAVRVGALGRPVLSSRQGSLDEVLPADLPTIAGYDVDAGRRPRLAPAARQRRPPAATCRALRASGRRVHVGAHGGRCARPGRGVTAAAGRTAWSRSGGSPAARAGRRGGRGSARTSSIGSLVRMLRRRAAQAGRRPGGIAPSGLRAAARQLAPPALALTGRRRTSPGGMDRPPGHAGRPAPGAVDDVVVRQLGAQALDLGVAIGHRVDVVGGVVPVEHRARRAGDGWPDSAATRRRSRTTSSGRRT